MRSSYIWPFGRPGVVSHVLNLLDACVALGLLSGAVLAATLGRFMLTAILGLLAVGVALRFIRRKARRGAG